MLTPDIKTSVKVVGTNGQISLGKEFAGRQVLVEEREPGVWLIRTARVIPENELWLHEPKASQDLQRALAWAQATPTTEQAACRTGNVVGDCPAAKPAARTPTTA